ncbi:MAG: hypothetical protein CTY25_11835 [Methylobacterium sp.]|nr:MAG: hypothetical protein CTY25_11835 [Methylobacterium sp.]
MLGSRRLPRKIVAKSVDSSQLPRKRLMSKIRFHDIQAKAYPGFGRCIFCDKDAKSVSLTDEHIIPRALSLKNEILIRNGSCSECNAYCNQSFENKCINTNFVSYRKFIELKRRKRGKNSKEIKLPRAVIGDFRNLQHESKIFDLDDFFYPRLLIMPVFLPAGNIVGCDRGGDCVNPSFTTFNLGGPSLNFLLGDVPISTQKPMAHTEFSLMLAKIAYCFAVAELGIDGFDRTQILNLIFGRRHDAYNYVGSASQFEYINRSRFHRIYVRQKRPYISIVVHLFAQCGSRPFEIYLCDAPDENL